ncbi:MAG: hypothetical protein IT440_11240, partial [Phycisphaeraceae bacterium]|nr:hypothetical protein [Phycisphaeraceae bacterium]
MQARRNPVGSSGVTMRGAAAYALWRRPPLRMRLQRLWFGLHQPHDSGAYQYARLQMLRLLSPASALVFLLVVILLLSLWHRAPSVSSRAFVTMVPDAVSPPVPLDASTPLPDVPIPDRTELAMADAIALVAQPAAIDVALPQESRRLPPAMEGPRVPV